MARLLEDPNITTAIHAAFPAIESVLMEQQRTSVSSATAADMGAILVAMNSNLKVLEKFSDKGQEVLNQKQTKLTN